MIVVEHVGISDKPIFTLKFTTQKSVIQGDFEKVIRVEKAAYKILKNFILGNRNSVNNATLSQPFGTFKISIIKDKNSVVFFLTKAEAIAFFKTLVVVLKSGNYGTIEEEFNILIKRIDN